jgi:hypothetical protein
MKQIQLFELQENETWNESWIHIGLFESEESANKFKIQRIKKLKKEFDSENPNSFESWYNWSVSPKRFYISDISENTQKSIERLKTQDPKDWDVTDMKLIVDLFLNNFIMKD